MIKKRLESWYQGKACSCCERGFGVIRWHEHKPALISPDHKLLQWKDVLAEEMSQVLATHEPVCGTCNFGDRSGCFNAGSNVTWNVAPLG